MQRLSKKTLRKTFIRGKKKNENKGEVNMRNLSKNEKMKIRDRRKFICEVCRKTFIRGKKKNDLLSAARLLPRARKITGWGSQQIQSNYYPTSILDQITQTASRLLPRARKKTGWGGLSRFSLTTTPPLPDCYPKLAKKLGGGLSRFSLTTTPPLSQINPNCFPTAARLLPRARKKTGCGSHVSAESV